MTELKTGTYASKSDKVVTYWPAPDKDGTGDEIWEDRYDSSGRSLGRNLKKDEQGNVVRRYPAPEGFRNIPSFDHTDNYVRTNPNGSIYRTPEGEAIGIKEGQAIVENADGTIEVLTDEYARHIFALSHDKVSSAAPSPADVPDDVVDEEPDDDKNKTPAKATPATVGKAVQK
jgi:hypothetical protein